MGVPENRGPPNFRKLAYVVEFPQGPGTSSPPAGGNSQEPGVQSSIQIFTGD